NGKTGRKEKLTDWSQKLNLSTNLQSGTWITAIPGTLTGTCLNGWLRLILSKETKTSSLPGQPGAGKATWHRHWACTPAIWFSKPCILTRQGLWMKLNSRNFRE